MSSFTFVQFLYFANIDLAQMMHRAKFHMRIIPDLDCIFAVFGESFVAIVHDTLVVVRLG